MSTEIQIGSTTVRLEKGDITDQEVDAFVFYAQHDLKLGSGFGTAISGRGGPAIQKELDEMGPLETCQAVISGAGNMKADKIIHAVGPRFQEPDLENKLAVTMDACFKLAEENDISTLAFPTMGTGFYGVPLDVSARIMLESIKKHLEGETSLKKVVVYALDTRDFEPFQSRFGATG